jgi:RNA polymerase sigma-70 factor, ECF subfamily
MTDTMDLGRGFARGDELALRRVYERYSGPMFAIAMGQLGDRSLAEEAVQRAFIQAWQAAGSFDTTRELGPWLYQIVRRCAVDVHRSHRKQQPTSSLDEVPDSTVAQDAISADQLWITWTVRAAVDDLEPWQRDVVHLAYFEDLGYSEIAARLGIAVGTVKSRVFRAHRRLAELLLPHVPHMLGR